MQVWVGWFDFYAGSSPDAALKGLISPPETELGIFRLLYTIEPQ